MQSMDEIYQKYARTVYKYLMSLTHKEELAEELTQETFYEAIRSSDRFDGSCKLTTWLCAIAKNVLLTHRRKHPPHEDVAEMAETIRGTDGLPEDDLLRSESRVELFRKVHELPEPFRETVYLRVFGGLSFREIGDVLGKTENWARVNFYRGKEKLRKEVNRDE